MAYLLSSHPPACHTPLPPLPSPLLFPTIFANSSTLHGLKEAPSMAKPALHPPSEGHPTCLPRRVVLWNASTSPRSRPQPPGYQRKKTNRPWAYEMESEETGEKVIVWGVEDDRPPPVPSAKDLKWKHVNTALPGNVSESSWLRAMEAAEAADASASDDGLRGSVPRGMVEVFPQEQKIPMSLKENDANFKRSGIASKGLFSRLKVQTLRAIPKTELRSMASHISNKDQFVQKQNNTEASKRFGSRSFPLESQNNDHLTRNKGKQSSQKTSSTSKSGLAEDFFSIKSFKDIGATDGIIQVLASMQVKHPSQIQAMAYQHVFQGQSCIIAEQTGSGKTLAYLAPLIQRLKQEEKEGSSSSLPKRPRTLILVPTSELASQVLSVCRAISKGGILVKSMVATGRFRLRTQVEGLDDSSDILVATPGRLLQLLDSRSLFLDNLLSIILDEVDILLDDAEFSDVLKRIDSSVSLKVQYIHVTATLPVDVHNNLLERHPDSIPLIGPGLHCTAPGLKEILVDCSGDGEKTPETAFENKKTALLQLVEEQPVSKTIIFCNKIETCRKVENVLKRLDRSGRKFSVLPYHAAISQEARLENMQLFMTPENPESEKSLFLVCTDRASRGLDLVDVEHVLLFDFPRDPSEYVRRVGRTARAGGSGKAFVFVVGKQVALARRTMMRNEKGHPLHTIPSSSG